MPTCISEFSFDSSSSVAPSSGLVTRLRSILISYGKQVRHLTKSTPHLEQVSSENPGDEALAASPSTLHEPATACQMKGQKLPRCPKIGRPPEGHASEPPRPAPNRCPSDPHIFFLQVVYSAARLDCRPLIPRTRSMEVHAQTLPSSSQSPEVAAMEKQVRDLTANLQELTRQNQVLNQKLLQQEAEKQKTRDKGKSKERGDAESRQEQQEEQQQEQQQEQQHEQRQEQEGETKGNNTRITVEESSAKWEQELKAMRIQMGEMKDEFKGRTTKNLDDLVHTTDSPFTKSVISFPLPSKFRMPSLDTFDGSKDPLDHLESFKTVMCLQGVPDEIMCRAFPTTLKGPARVWFKKITPDSVGSFAQLSRLFFNHFIGAQRYGRPTTHLLNIKQKEGETLRSYLTRFNKETLLVDGADDKVVLTAFISGLQAGDFLFSVYKDPPSTMTEMMYEAQRHMNGEEALLARDQTVGKKRKWEHPDRPAEPHDTRPKAQRNRNRKHEDRNGRGFNERFNHFTPLNAPVDHIFMQIRNDPALKWPGEVVNRPRQKAEGQVLPESYRDSLKRGREKAVLKGPVQQRPPVEVLPRPPPLGEIHVITGGVAAGGTSHSSRKAYARQMRNVLVTQKLDKKPRLEDLPIIFAEEDARKVFHPHDDALVVTLEIAGYSTRRVLIDNGSSADIIYLTAFQQMRIDKAQLRPIETPLVGFAGTSVYPLGIITLQLVAGTYPKQVTKKVDFLVVDCPSAYNVIIGRPTLNRLRAVTSTYHLLVRFPTENGIGEMRGDQAMARECYLTSTSTEPVHQALIVEERQNIAEPTEALEEITLVEGLPNEKKTTRIGTSIKGEVRDSIIRFLRENADIFAWSHADMPGISTKVVAHQLNVNPSFQPVKQKRRVFAPERNAAVTEEVDKLLRAGFIREVYYPEWLANVVMVKKATGKWRMCVDFTDLNKACPKDSYPLPRIDQLVDSTAGHKLLSFMDAFSGYNQIQMAEEDQEKTAFITSRGLFCYKVMPFGLKNAGATYQRLVNKMFHDQIGRNVEVYVDDMLVKSKKDDDHLADLKETFQALRRYSMKLNPAKCVFGVSSGKFLGFHALPRRGKRCICTWPYLPSAVSSALIREEEHVQKAVYYTSRALRGAEERYTNMEKLAFALLIASRKLRPYFQAHSIIVMTDYPIRKAMNKPDAAGRLVQWSIEMGEFDIDYRPRTAIKAQALADFIAEFTHPLEEGEKPEEGEPWTVNIDGSSTKEMSGAGVILVSPEGDKFEYALQLRFHATNNEAEYEALLAGLRLSKGMGIKALTVKSDSQLIVGQVKGEYEAKEDRMKKYLTTVKTLLAHFEKVELLQIPREDNVAADRLARLASSGIEIDGLIEIQGRPSTEEEIVNSIANNTTWMSPITRYLREGTLPADRTEAHKLRIRASHFRLLGGILYKMGFSRPYLRCLSPEEANYAIREVHEGICGNHSGARSLAHKLTRAGYYWPSLLHDAAQYVKTCDKCQRFANIPRVPPEETTPITSPWPFAQWGLDIMGPFPVGTKQAKFLVVAIDYFTKWVEAEPLAIISEKNVKSFVWKAVICRFGIPRVLISDNGKQFDNGPFREMCNQLNIKNHYSSPRHPQANGQVEVTNRTLLKQIKTRLEGAKGMWVEELPSILWAYRTTVRTPTRETPFKLTFGTEAVIPVEIGLTTFRTTFHREEENEGQLRLNLDLLDEARGKAAQRIALYQGRMARYYNTRVKLRRFEVGDWVLRKVSQATKDPSQGKLGPNWEGPYKVTQYYRRGTYHLEDRHGKKLPHPWNAEHLKKYYP
uniref:RNA-directed DNA polymerase n=1 Tax=Fagus sylvatica TaxID=28930 RepID=A0A2N9J111_FAGSY